jgi:hypothetical protein
MTSSMWASTIIVAGRRRTRGSHTVAKCTQVQDVEFAVYPQEMNHISLVSNADDNIGVSHDPQRDVMYFSSHLTGTHALLL